MVRARAASTAVITAVITLVLGVGSSYGAYQLALSNVELSSLAGRLFIAPLSQFRWPFLGGAAASDYLGFAVGVLILIALAALIALIGARSASVSHGGSAVFLSTWMAVVIAALVSKVAYMFLAQDRILGDNAKGDLVTAFYTSGAFTSVYWGVLTGWIAALIAVVTFKIANRKLAREASSEDDGWPLSAPTSTPPVSAAPTPTPGFTYPSGTNFEEPVPYGSANAYDAGTPQSQSRYAPLSSPDVVSEQSQIPYGSNPNTGPDEDPYDRTQQIPRT